MNGMQDTETWSYWCVRHFKQDGSQSSHYYMNTHTNIPLLSTATTTKNYQRLAKSVVYTYMCLE